MGVDVLLLVGVEGVVAHSGWETGTRSADGGIRWNADERE